MAENSQFIRTDKAIIRALIALLKHKPFEKITVQDILDETPVTRATFYAHFRDKYEIAERMLSHFLKQRSNIRRALATYAYPSVEILRSNTSIDREFTSALLKIHTEKVDFRQVVASEIEAEYLRSSDSPTKELEARIYAHAYVELYLAMFEQHWPELSMEQMFQMLISVSIKLLQLPGDQETRAFLSERIAKRQPEATHSHSGSNRP